MKNVAIRLDDAKYKKLRVVAVHCGTTLQRAVEAAIDLYLAETALTSPSANLPLKDYRGFLRDTDVMELMERDRQEELARDRSRL